MARHLLQSRGDFAIPLLLSGETVAFGKLQNGFCGKDRILDKLDPLAVAFLAAPGKTRLQFGNPRIQPVAYGRSEIGRDVEHHALLAESRAGSAARLHLGIGMEIRYLPHRAKERKTLAVHECGSLRLQHLLETYARTCLVARPLGREAIQQRLPIDISTELRLFLVERPLQQTLDSLRHFNSLTTNDQRLNPTLRLPNP